MPDHLGSDQRKVKKDDKKEEKIEGMKTEAIKYLFNSTLLENK